MGGAVRPNGLCFTSASSSARARTRVQRLTNSSARGSPSRHRHSSATTAASESSSRKRGLLNADVLAQQPYGRHLGQQFRVRLGTGGGHRQRGEAQDLLTGHAARPTGGDQDAQPWVGAHQRAEPRAGVARGLGVVQHQDRCLPGYALGEFINRYLLAAAPPQHPGAVGCGPAHGLGGQVRLPDSAYADHGHQSSARLCQQVGEGGDFGVPADQPTPGEPRHGAAAAFARVIGGAGPAPDRVQQCLALGGAEPQSVRQQPDRVQPGDRTLPCSRLRMARTLTVVRSASCRCVSPAR